MLMAITQSASFAVARDYQAGALRIVEPWTRATPPNAQVAGGFLSVSNGGTTADRLLGGSAPIAARVEIHEMTMEGSVMRMKPLHAGLTIAPGASVTLKPGSYHLMFFGLTAPLKAGETIKGTLEFEKAGKVDVEFKVEAMGAMAH